MQTVFPGLEEDLYRDAEARRLRKLHREEEAWHQAQLGARQRLSRSSRARFQERLAKDLRNAFFSAGGEPQQEDMVVPRSHLPSILEALGYLNAVDDEEHFCASLIIFLDKEDLGLISFRRLLDFLIRAMDREAHHERIWLAGSLDEECLRQLEMRLSRDLSRLQTNRLSRPRADSSRSLSRAGSPRTSRMEARSISPCARTPSPTLATRHARESPSRPAQRECPPSATPRQSARRPHSARPAREAQDPVGMTRCHLLYQQAVFASKESAQLEEEIKFLKQREEMRECTFHPKLLPSRRGNSPRPQPRNFETAVARMRAAARRREEHREESRHVPCGENYERLRRLGAQPFACYFKERGVARRTPLVYVDVDVGRGRTGRIGLHEGDNLGELASNFAKAFQLDRETQVRLEGLLQKAYDTQLAAEGEKTQRSLR